MAILLQYKIASALAFVVLIPLAVGGGALAGFGAYEIGNALQESGYGFNSEFDQIILVPQHIQDKAFLASSLVQLTVQIASTTGIEDINIAVFESDEHYEACSPDDKIIKFPSAYESIHSAAIGIRTDKTWEQLDNVYLDQQGFNEWEKMNEGLLKKHGELVKNIHDLNKKIDAEMKDLAEVSDLRSKKKHRKVIVDLQKKVVTKERELGQVTSDLFDD